jgi:L-2,4-diaminobutyrate decarboxylase
LLAPVTLTTVLFRVAGRGLAAAELDAVQGEVRRRLLTSGRVLIGRTKVPARGGRPAAVALKLTLLNPNATATDVEELLDHVVATGHDVLSEGAA